VLRQLEEESLQKWQRSWTQTTKGGTTKEYFPDIEERIKMKLNHTENITTVLMGHGNIKGYLNRFQISDDSTCPCGKGEQITDHIIYDCDRLTNETDKLEAAITKTNTWKTKKGNLIKRHYNEFSKFINSVSFEVLKAG
jgi:hypothetical protein